MSILHFNVSFLLYLLTKLYDFSKRGLCYTFNSGKPGYQLRYQPSPGRSQGLILFLNAEPEQYYGPFNMFEGTGFRILIHDQNEWPDIENYGIEISPGFSSTIQIRRFKVCVREDVTPN